MMLKMLLRVIGQNLVLPIQEELRSLRKACCPQAESGLGNGKGGKQVINHREPLLLLFSGAITQPGHEVLRKPYFCMWPRCGFVLFCFEGLGIGDQGKYKSLISTLLSPSSSPRPLMDSVLKMRVPQNLKIIKHKL